MQRITRVQANPWSSQGTLNISPLENIARHGAQKSLGTGKAVTAGGIHIVRHLHAEAVLLQWQTRPGAGDDLPQEVQPFVHDGALQITMLEGVGRGGRKPLVLIQVCPPHFFLARQHPIGQAQDVVVNAPALRGGLDERRRQLARAGGRQYRVQGRVPTFGGGAPRCAGQVGVGTGKGGAVQGQRYAGRGRAKGDVERVVRLHLQGKGVAEAVLEDESQPGQGGGVIPRLHLKYPTVHQKDWFYIFSKPFFPSRG